MTTKCIPYLYGRGGFGLLAPAAVFPHFDKRGSAAAVKFSAEYPDQLGIGIDEETGLIVKGDSAKVIGQCNGQHIRRQTPRESRRAS